MVKSTNSALLVPAPDPATNAVAGDIRALKAPVAIADGWTWLLWALGFLAVVALGWWAFKKWGKPKPAQMVLIPPHRRAKDRLRAATELISEPYRFCSLVSDVLRLYLEERFELHAPDRTTEEFLAELGGRSTLSESQKALLATFLSQCDLVKFARHEPTEPELRALLDTALRLIDETAQEPNPAAGQAR